MSDRNPILDAYNEGLGDGLVAATAIMGGASNEIVQEIKAEIVEKRRQFKAPAARPEDRDNG